MWSIVLFACAAPVDPLLVERAALRPVEHSRLMAVAEGALGEGRWAEAGHAVAAGLRLDPTGFAPLAHRLDEALAHAPPELAAVAHAALYDAAATAEARVLHRDAATDAAAKARYVDGQVPATRAAQRGVTRAMALDAVAMLREGFVDELPEDRLVAAAARRLGVLTGRPVVAPQAAVDEALGALWDQAVDLGVPEETAVAELTEAVFSAADPWSAPVWPARVSSWQDRHDGVVSGVVGVVLDSGPEGVFVRELVEGGSAWTAGLHQGDLLVSVGGERARDPEPTASNLRGPDGTEVEVVVRRGGAKRTFTLVRGQIRARSVFGWQRTNDGFDPFVAPRIALIRVASFRPHTDEELTALLPDRTALDGLILDLRGNRGGDLEPALILIERFVAGGAVIRVHGRVIPEGLQGDFAVARSGDAWEGMPLAVLVDHETASSAEVVAGALQQLAGAKVIGDRTAGKGTSQILRTDSSWAYALQYTNLVWALPDGRRLHRADEASSWGIEPDVREVLSPTERFLVGVQQARREALIAHVDGVPMSYTGAEIDPSLPVLSEDPQIRAALAVFGGGAR